MADTSLFTRLKRLFSSDVIIRNVGGKQLKNYGHRQDPKIWKPSLQIHFTIDLHVYINL